MNTEKKVRSTRKVTESESEEVIKSELFSESVSKKVIEGLMFSKSVSSCNSSSSGEDKNKKRHKL